VKFESGYHGAMPGSGATRLGPVARKLISPDVWADGYPGPPAYVKELDVLLKFADQHDCLDRFVPNLEARNRQRDKALNELRLAFLFDSLDFPVIGWDPPGLDGRVGEFLLNCDEKVPIFTEIKSPGWESELSDAEIAAGRALQPKYEKFGGGAIGNWQAVHRCISSPKTYPKFTADQSNMLIIADDLKVPLHDTLFQVGQALYGPKRFFGEVGYFTTNRFENIGGLGVFGFFSGVPSRGLEYEFVVFENPHALPTTKLPPSMLKFRETFKCIVRGTER
jgi:hypothetical protein